MSRIHDVGFNGSLCMVRKQLWAQQRLLLIAPHQNDTRQRAASWHTDNCNYACPPATRAVSCRKPFIRIHWILNSE